jgi:hypothetical protein
MAGTPAQDRPAFFTPDGGVLVPEPIALGPWGNTMRGKLLGGLTAREVDRFRAGDPELRCTRLTIDLFRAPVMAPVRTAARVVRDGKRIKVLEVTIHQEDGPVGQGLAVLLRRGEQPPGPFRQTPAWEELTPATGLPFTVSHRWPPTWESWNIAGEESMGEGLWVRELHDMVPGEPLTPLTRMALASDVASPVAHSAPGRLSFINADFTVYLGREPRGEHIGIQPYGHVSDDGLAVGQCIAHDLDGPVGFIATTAVANSVARARQPAPGQE